MINSHWGGQMENNHQLAAGHHLTEDDQMLLTSTYHVLEMFKDTKMPKHLPPMGRSVKADGGATFPQLSMLVSKKDGKLSLCNLSPSMEADLQLELELSGLNGAYTCKERHFIR